MRSDANDFAAEEKLSSEERIDRPGEMEEQMHSVSAYYPFIGQIRGLIKDALVPRWRNLSSHFRKQRKQERTSFLFIATRSRATTLRIRFIFDRCRLPCLIVSSAFRV